jgi:DNA-binding NarL/FixJ family response regulator
LEKTVLRIKRTDAGPANGCVVQSFENVFQNRGNTMPTSLRILVADDNAAIRNGLCSVLERRSGWRICGHAVDGMDAVQKAVALRPDVILLDVSMPGLNGFEVAERIHKQLPDAEILIVTEHDARTLEQLPSQPGVRGYIVKSRIERDLVPAVEAASRHQPVSTTAAA